MHIYVVTIWVMDEKKLELVGYKFNEIYLVNYFWKIISK